MVVTTEIKEEKNLIIHSFKENVTFESIVKTIGNTLANPKYHEGMNAIWYCDDDAKVNVTSEESLKIGDIARNAFDKNGISYKLALVASSDLAFGMNRVYEGWNNDRPIQIKTFRDINDAFVWMDEE